MADIISTETAHKSFSDIVGLEGWIIRHMKNLYLKHPTPVQFHCIPEILKGRDVLGSAKTGSGKTLAFTLPMLQKLSKNPYGIFSLVLTPTRELAAQTAELIKTVGAPLNVKVCLVTGGMDYIAVGRQLSANPHIVVATPGRLADCLSGSYDFNFNRIQFLVLDEADRLWNGDFDKDLIEIWKLLPKQRQTLMFSATMTDAIVKMRDSCKNDLYIWDSKDSQATVQQLKEKYCLVKPTVREAVLMIELLKFITEQPKKLAIVFTDSAENAHLLNKICSELDIDSTCLHSLMKQKERKATLAKFAASRVKVLISTDLASRGLDVPNVTLVINHKIPKTPSAYVHRVGRTARFGREGTSLTIIIPNEIQYLVKIEETTKIKMTEVKVDDKAILKVLTQVNLAKSKHKLRLEDNELVIKKNINLRKDDILAGKDPEEERKKREQKKAIREKNEKINFWQRKRKSSETQDDADNKEESDKTNSEEETPKVQTEKKRKVIKKKHNNKQKK